MTTRGHVITPPKENVTVSSAKFTAHATVRALKVVSFGGRVAHVFGNGLGQAIRARIESVNVSVGRHPGSVTQRSAVNATLAKL